ncbi:MAG: FAD-dependent oxidoreductase [Kiritimatiellaeota bacterium]|nr:FAD-dependent oxidoreductase [Kiritimatiellota bacterium]
MKSRTVLDVSGHGNDGTISHAFLVEGVRGAGIRFDNRTMHVRILHGPDLIPRNAMSVEAWVRPARFPPSDYATILRKDGAFALRFGAGGRLGFLVWEKGKPVGIEAPSTGWRADRWRHVAATWDGRALRLFLGGVQVAETPFSGMIDETATPLYIGAYAGRWPFLGAIDEVRIYARELSAAEIAAEAAAGRRALARPRGARQPAREIGRSPARFRKPKREVSMIEPGFVWIDAEDFTDYGGWLLDTQFVHLMGSAYLIAAGIGRPVKDATVEFELPAAGRYRLWVRARNWLPEYTPGTFAVLVDGRGGARAFGAAKTDKWVWERGDEFELTKGTVRLALRDLTGGYGRCDALILTTDAGFSPPDTLEGVRRERSRLTGLNLDPRDGGEFDVIVVGAGAAGSVAALAAARMGAKTALIQNRPVLGGNASIELGVGINGAASGHPNARESGIIEEVGRIKARYAYPRWSEPFRTIAMDEKNLTVFLNEHVFAVDMDGANRIAAARSVNTLTNRITRYRGKYFIDCTGDGWVGYFAKAKYRLGREARSEFNESLAPEKSDKITMSGCLMGEFALAFRAVNTGQPVRYTPPPWAYNLPAGNAFGRNIRSVVSGEWWIEHPGTIDDLWQAEKARDELIRITFGYWDYLKNKWSERKRAADYTLAYVPIMDAKRESRRLMGDVILTQNDVQSARVFPDRVSYGGWPLDVHHPRGILSGKAGPFDCNPRVPIYTIPFRCLYSVNIDNLLFAGRDVSVTHIALGSVRVQGTLATLGQAVGTAAALCVKHRLTPRELCRERIGELQQTLLKYDQYIPGLRNEDPNDYARRATVSASSTARFDLFGRDQVRGEAIHPLNMDRSVIFPASGVERIESIFLRLASARKRPVRLVLHLRSVTDPANLSTGVELGTVEGEAPPESEVWVEFRVDRAVAAPFLQVWLPRTEGLSWRLMTRAPQGSCRAYGDGARNAWQVQPNQFYAFYTRPPLSSPASYAPENVVNGVARPVGVHTNMWVSDPTKPLPQWLQLDFTGPVEINTVYLTFDTDLNAPFHTVPLPAECVRDYTLSYRDANGKWVELVAVEGNFQRRRIHRFAPRITGGLRLTVQATNGDPAARVFEIRAYNEP